MGGVDIFDMNTPDQWQHASLQPSPDRSRCRQSAGSMVVPVVVPVGYLVTLRGSDTGDQGRTPAVCLSVSSCRWLGSANSTPPSPPPPSQPSKCKSCRCVFAFSKMEIGSYSQVSNKNGFIFTMQNNN